jgi:MinD-like ATPase involved in chromosome partitioning or flagellar assembly
MGPSSTHGPLGGGSATAEPQLREPRAERRVPPFLVLLGDDEAAAVAAILTRSAPPGALRVLVPPWGLDALMDGEAEVDRWWERQGGSASRPVVVLEHREGLAAALSALDADFVVAVVDHEQPGAYGAPPPASVRFVPAGDARGLAHAALAAAGLRPAPAPAALPPDPFSLLAHLDGRPPEPGAAEVAAADSTSPGPAGAAGGWGRLLRLTGIGSRRPRGLAALGRAMLTREPPLVVVVSRKGGVGRTACAEALAAIFGEALAPFGRTSALVDGDVGNPEVLGHFEVSDRAPTLREIVAALTAGEEPPSPAWSGLPGLDVYPEARESGDGYTPGQVQRLARQLRQRHAAIVVDLPSRLPSFTSGEAALAAAWIGEADLVIVPTTPDPAALLGAVEYLEVESVRGKPALVPCIVPRLRGIREAPEVRPLRRRIAEQATLVEVPADDRAILARIRRLPITRASRRLRRAYLTLAGHVVDLLAGEPSDPLAGVSFCLLFDLCAWLAGSAAPVTTGAYALTSLRATPDPRRRLGAYVDPGLLARWDRALRPFFACGVQLLPELDPTGVLQRHGPALGELSFSSRCSVLDRDRRPHALPPRSWVLSVRLGLDASRVADAALRAGQAPGA